MSKQTLKHVIEIPVNQLFLDPKKMAAYMGATGTSHNEATNNFVVEKDETFLQWPGDEGQVDRVAAACSLQGVYYRRYTRKA